MPIYPTPIAIFVVCLFAAIAAAIWWYNNYPIAVVDRTELTDDEFRHLEEGVIAALDGDRYYIIPGAAYNYVDTTDDFLGDCETNEHQELTFWLLVAEAESC